jgi:hypothetical protein
MAGMLDWDAIEDRVRRPRAPNEYSGLSSLVDAALYSYRLPRMKGQETYVELWVEKDALAGVLSPIASKYHVVLMVNRGYSSASAMKDAGDRVRSRCEDLGCTGAKIFYLGDHDPSGEDMVRDVDRRLDLFCNHGYHIEADGTIESEEERDDRKPRIEIGVEKIALTMEQVKKHKPPPNPAKITDPRAKAYIAKFGEHSWEVDALPPDVLRKLIEAKLDDAIDDALVQEICDREETDKKLLRKAVASIR